MAIQAQQLFSENIGLPFYCGGTEWVENGCSGGGGDFNQFSFDFQLQQKMQQLQQQQWMLQLQSQAQHQMKEEENMFFNSGSNSKHPDSTINQEILSNLNKQKQEIDHYIRSQNERLRIFLHHQRKQQIAVIMKKIESKALILLRQKDEEIARATNKTTDLEHMLKKLEMENQAWQRVAQENESMVASLNNELELLKERISCCFNNGEEDAESCCNVPKTEEEEKEKEKEQRIVCKCCNSRTACVLFLPCRHLCSCIDCEVSLDSCPFCKTEKKSIEALIFWGEEIGDRKNKKRKSDNHD